MLSGKLAGNQFHWATLRLAIPPVCEILQSHLMTTASVVSTVRTIVGVMISRVDGTCVLSDRISSHIGELIMSHLHQLALVLYLPLSQFKCLVCHRVS